MTQRLGIVMKTRSTPGNRQKNVPAARRRIDNEIKYYRKDLSRLTDIENKNHQIRAGEYLEKKYNITEKGTAVIREILKQKIKAANEKIKRFEEKSEQYRHNRLFNENQKKFYQERANAAVDKIPPPEPVAAKEFWENIWGKAYTHRAGA